ncbi:MAG TPA: helix-turn-helix transcriptional regulator [Chitinophagaceae bacterium]|nr:helix-turn-helix transcriptional regulator [Chitinophagaceae bacterium]
MNESQLLIAVGQNIKKIRTQKKMSQNKLAEACRFEKASMSRIEAGKTNVTLLTLLKISTALEVNVRDFFE